MFEQIVSLLNRIVWSPALVILLVGAGLYFTLRTRFVQVRRFGLMILCSGCYNVFDAAGGEMIYAGAPALGENYVGFTQAAVDSVLPGFGGTFVSIALVFFVFTTVMAYYFYGETSIITLFEGHPERKKVEQACIWTFRFVLLGMAVFGSLREYEQSLRKDPEK